MASIIETDCDVLYANRIFYGNLFYNGNNGTAHIATCFDADECKSTYLWRLSDLAITLEIGPREYPDG